MAWFKKKEKTEAAETEAVETVKPEPAQEKIPWWKREISFKKKPKETEIQPEPVKEQPEEAAENVSSVIPSVQSTEADYKATETVSMENAATYGMQAEIVSPAITAAEEKAPAEEAVTEEAPEEIELPQEKPQEKPKKKGFFARLKEGLKKTRDNFVYNLDIVFEGAKSIDDDFYEELEEILIMGDIGVRATEEILDNLRETVRKKHIVRPSECKQVLIDEIKEQMGLGQNAYAFEHETSIVFVIGVNGVGKTTTIGKLAFLLKAKKRRVMMAAADTFRAAAGDQLKIWAERAGVDMIGGKDGADPASVLYDAVAAAKARKIDVLLVDTAGRLHNKKNLMEELKKMNRIIDREYPDAHRENLIVLDATTGQNALQQAREFGDVTDLTGIILTKMDGTAKGGIAVAIQSELKIPVKYIGVGEKIKDLQKFNADSFVEALFDVDLTEEEEEELSAGDDTEDFDDDWE